MTFDPSPYQRRIFEWIEKGRGSAIVVAVAGSGKTTTLVEGWRRIPERASVQSLAFNATIAKEMNARLDALRAETGRAFRGFRCSTFHSLGFGAVAKRLGKSAREIETRGDKLSKLFSSTFDEATNDLYSDFVVKLVSLAKGQGIGAIQHDDDGAWFDLVRHHDLYLDSEDANEERAIELARELLRLSNAAAERGHIDFDDQLYLPLLWRLRLWQNDWVFVDEAQDTNPVRRAIAKLALRPGGRLVAVGDPRQAIYGFTGASHDAIELIRREFNAIELPLTVSYRCPAAVGALARGIVDYFEVAPGAPEGKVETLAAPEALKALGPHDAVLCRNTAPLISFAYGLIAQRRGCVVLGREIGAGLVNLVKKMRAKGIDSLSVKLAVYRDREVAKFTARGEEGKAEAVNDRVACVGVCIQHLDENERTIPALLRRIEGLFSDTNGVLTLSTVHKAKGKEWDAVAILSPELMPSPWARQEWQAQQEQNLMYVAYTRAKRHLIFIPSPAAAAKEAA